jgi:energy-coupling factor transporter ATP-binding protein EcfA2
MSAPRSDSVDEPVPHGPLVERRYEIDFLLLNIRQGTSCQVVGPTGAGKTSLLLMLAHRVEHDHPDIEIIRGDRLGISPASEVGREESQDRGGSLQALWTPEGLVQKVEQIESQAHRGRRPGRRPVLCLDFIGDPHDAPGSGHDVIRALHRLHRAEVVLITTARRPLDEIYADDPPIALFFDQFEVLHLVPEAQRDVLDALLPFSVREPAPATEPVRLARSRLRHMARVAAPATPLLLAVLVGVGITTGYHDRSQATLKTQQAELEAQLQQANERLEAASVRSVTDQALGARYAELEARSRQADERLATLTSENARLRAGYAQNLVALGSVYQTQGQSGQAREA